MHKYFDVIIFITKYFLRNSRVVIFADIIKIMTIFIKKIFTDSKKTKRNDDDVSRIQGVSHTIHILLRSSLIIVGYV